MTALPLVMVFKGQLARQTFIDVLKLRCMSLQCALDSSSSMVKLQEKRLKTSWFEVGSSFQEGEPTTLGRRSATLKAALQLD